MHDLISISQREQSILQNVLRPYASWIDLVGVFGSRVTKKARPASDIDLVIYGQLNESQFQRLWTLFNESYLAVTVDIVDYARISHAPLKRHIDTEMLPLFVKSDLLEMA